MRLVWICLCGALSLAAQPYDIVLKGGHVLDPGNGLDAVLDVAITGDKIAAVRAGIPAAEARRMIDVTGLYVTPGLIDIHAHVFGNDNHLLPDETDLPTGTTTVVDAGGSGWRSFENFRQTVMAQSKTRVLAMINILGAGMVGDENEQSDTNDMDAAKTGEMILRYPDRIVGVKTAHFDGHGWTAIDRAREAGRIGKVPIMVDDKIFTGTGRTTREKVLDHLRPGDIHTHMFNDRQIELVDRFTGKVQPYMLEARRHGVHFDMGHGAGSFLWTVATKALAQGFPPDTISTDLHSASILAGQPDMPNCMSKMMLLGMPLADAVLRSTVNPAKTVGRYPEIGTLGVGKVADVAVLDLRRGVFAFKDSWNVKKMGTERLENVLTVRDGKLVYDRDGRAAGAVLSKIGPAGGALEIYDLLLKNGQVIDPANHRKGRYDVAITGNKIAKVAVDIAAVQARAVIDVNRYYVTPGLIDINTHLQADHHSLRNGVTTAVAMSLDPKTVEHSKTRLLAAPVVLLEAGDSDEGIGKLRSGDILTQMYRRLTPAVAEARKRGVILDVGHGSQGFRFSVAKAALAQGLLPDTISSGIDLQGLLAQGADMMTTLSKLLNLGMTMEQLVERTTVNPAGAIHHKELGTLSEGSAADVAVLAEEHGTFGYVDAVPEKLAGDRRLRCLLTVRNGAIVWDSDGLGATDASRTGPYSNFR